MISIAKPILDATEKEAVLSVLDSGIIAQGPRVGQFEKEFAAYCAVPHAVAVSSGTTALTIALLAHGIGKGDEVITTPFSFIATANSILYTGATPVFVDIDRRTFNMDPAKIEKAITSRTRAILPVHLYGQCCDMSAITDIAERHDLIIVEDACQSHGATYNGKKAGSFGTGTFSFYPTKNMTCGEGGMITTSNEEVAEQCRIIRNHGMRQRYYHEQIGYNFRMTDIAASIGIEQLKKLDGFNAKRQEHAQMYNDHLSGVIAPLQMDQCKHVYHQYTLRIENGRRDALREFLRANEIGSEIYYPLPIHHQQVIKEQIPNLPSLPVAESSAEEVLSIPVHPSLTQDDIMFVIKKINLFLEQHNA